MAAASEWEEKITVKLKQLYDSLPPEVKEKQPYPKVTLAKDGSARGKAYYRINRINLNPVYLATGGEEVVSQTLPHELAHLLSYNIDSETGHGKAWRKWCKFLGIDPTRCHSEGLVSANMDKFIQFLNSNNPSLNNQDESEE